LRDGKTNEIRKTLCRIHNTFFVNWIKDLYECDSLYDEKGRDILEILIELKEYYVGRVTEPLPVVLSYIDEKIDEVTEMYEMEEEKVA
jgi:hypothetical protein